MQTTMSIQTPMTSASATMHGASPASTPAWITEMYMAVETYDVAAFLNFLAPNCLFRFGNAAPIYGRAAIREMVTGMFTSLQGLQHEIIETWVQGRTTICRGNVTYIRQDDSTLTVPFVVIFKLDKQLVQEYLIYVDISQLFG